MRQDLTVFPIVIFQKADVVTGLPPGRAEKLTQLDPKWMVGGDWAVVQTCQKIELLS